MKARERALEVFGAWYEELPTHQASGGPARGTIGAALVVLDRLKDTFDLSLDSHRAKGESQIKGAGGGAVKRILAEFGEIRPFLKEGGRTNRGGPRDIGKMLDALRSIQLDQLSIHERNQILTDLQEFLVAKVREFHNRQRLRVTFDPAKSTWQSIHDLLVLARESGKEGPVAQYLVGAKLQLRFPTVPISNESYSTADDQSGRQGDFQIGDTIFHITVAPMTSVYEKCKRNLEEGLRVYLLVPNKSMIGARQIAESIAPGRIAIEAIESFVGHNIEELSSFSQHELIDNFRDLLETYNQRVDMTETDKSMLIEIPQFLYKQKE